MGRKDSQFKDKIITQTFHNTNQNLASNRFAAMNNLDYNRDVLGNGSGRTVGSQINRVSWMLYYVLLQNRMCQKMTFRHEIITGTPSISKGSGRGGILEPSCRIKELVTTQSEWVETGDTLYSFMQLQFTSNTIGDHKVIVMMGKVMRIVQGNGRGVED